jgi:hypothetical protein
MIKIVVNESRTLELVTRCCQDRFSVLSEVRKKDRNGPVTCGFASWGL